MDSHRLATHNSAELRDCRGPEAKPYRRGAPHTLCQEEVCRAATHVQRPTVVVVKLTE
jgi:hypothetical protein